MEILFGISYYDYIGPKDVSWFKIFEKSRKLNFWQNFNWSNLPGWEWLSCPGFNLLITWRFCLAFYIMIILVIKVCHDLIEFLTNFYFIKIALLEGTVVFGSSLTYCWANLFDILEYDDISLKGASWFRIFEKTDKLLIWLIFT